MGEFRFSIRELMILVVVGGILAWVVRRAGGAGILGRGWPLIVMGIALVTGWVWTIERIYKSPAGKQSPLIIGLVFLVIATLLMPLALLLFGFRYEF